MLNHDTNKLIANKLNECNNWMLLVRGKAMCECVAPWLTRRHPWGPACRCRESTRREPLCPTDSSFSHAHAAETTILFPSQSFKAPSSQSTKTLHSHLSSDLAKLFGLFRPNISSYAISTVAISTAHNFNLLHFQPSAISIYTNFG